MKKMITIAVILIAVTVPGIFGQNNPALSVWSFTDEVEGLINNYYLKEFPQTRVYYNFIPTDQFENGLDPVLASGNRVPDVFALEAAFVRKYVESGQLLDLTDIYQKNRRKILAYTAEIATYNGRVYALSWQACPGAFFYRRSIAKKYFGTDDPAEIQKLVSNFDKFLETAELLKQKSNGQAVMLASRGDLFNVFIDSRSQPWVVNGRLVIDPAMIKYMEMSKLFNERGYDARVGQWSDGWFGAMRDELKDANGRQYEAFGYFLPTWGLHYVLKPNAGRTAGDWAMCQGPVAYRWGGTWLAAWKNTPNPNGAKHLIEWLTTNDKFLEQYAKDSGDMVSNLNVIKKVAPSFREPFLGGQNHYAAFADMAQNVNGKLLQGTDSVINGIFGEATEAYMLGEITLEQALANFKAEVQSRLGIE